MPPPGAGPAAPPDEPALHPTIEWMECLDWPTAPQGRVGHTTCVIANHLWLFGGYFRYGHCLQQLHAFNMHTTEWREIDNPAVPEARTNHAACLLSSSKWLIFGGFNGSQYLGDLHVMHVTDAQGTVVWERDLQPSGPAPQPRQHCSMSRVGDRVYIFGGYTHGKAVGDLAILDVSEYESAGQLRWLPTVAVATQHAPTRRDGHMSFAFGDRTLVIFGGYDDMVYALDTREERWLPPEALAPCPATGASPQYRRLALRSDGALPATLFGGAPGAEWGVFVGGVDDYQNALLGDAWALDYAARQWRRLPAFPGGRLPDGPGGMSSGGLAVHYPMGQLLAPGGEPSADDCVLLLLWGGERGSNEKHRALYIAAPRRGGQRDADARVQAVVRGYAEAGAGLAAGGQHPCRACTMCAAQ